MPEQRTFTEPPVVLVTGASRGLGRGIALRLAELGMSVALNYAGNSRAAEETLELCRSAGRAPGQQFAAIRGNVGLEGDRERLLAETLSTFGRLDGLVNNAGIGPRVRADMLRTGRDSFREVLAVNLEGAFFLTQSVVNYWLGRKPEPRLPQGFTIVAGFSGHGFQHAPVVGVLIAEMVVEVDTREPIIARVMWYGRQRSSIPGTRKA